MQPCKQLCNSLSLSIASLVLYLQVLPTVILALATSAPLLLTKEPLGSGAGPAARRRVRIPPWQGLLFALSVLIAVALARFAIFDVVQVSCMFTGVTTCLYFLIDAMVLPCDAAFKQPSIFHKILPSRSPQLLWHCFDAPVLLRFPLTSIAPSHSVALYPRSWCQGAPQVACCWVVWRVLLLHAWRPSSCAAIQPAW